MHKNTHTKPHLNSFRTWNQREKKNRNGIAAFWCGKISALHIFCDNFHTTKLIIIAYNTWNEWYTISVDIIEMVAESVHFCMCANFNSAIYCNFCSGVWFVLSPNVFYTQLFNSMYTTFWTCAPVWLTFKMYMHKKYVRAYTHDRKIVYWNQWGLECVYTT